MYFGTKERRAWVKAPAPGAGFTATGYSQSIQYLNGGAGMRNSVNAHMEYDFSWGSLTMEEIAAIEDYAYSLYGNGLIYFADPSAMDRNLFNKAWAAPKITAEDGVSLLSTNEPKLVTVGNLTLDYPFHGAEYVITTSDVARSFYLPIPDGYTAWFGAHGTVSATGFLVQPMSGASASGSPISAGVLAVTNTTRFSTSVTGSSTINGVEIKLNTGSNITLTLAGLMLQLLPTGDVPEDGGFISGRGNNGCVFDGKPNVMPYSIPGGSIGMTAKLVEVGDHL